MAIRAVVLVLALCLSTGAVAQVWDFGTWHALKVGGELTKDLSLSVEQQLRLDENSTRINETFTELGLGYDLPKGFDISAAYRLAWSPERDGAYSAQHRYNIDLGFSENLWKFKIKARGRFQHRPSQSLLNERLEPDDSPIYVRIKLGIEYRKLKDWTPGFEFETFVRTDIPSEAGARRFRYRVFLDYDLPKRQELGIFYMLQTDHEGRIPEFTSTVGLSFSYDWKRPKKKKKGKD